MIVLGIESSCDETAAAVVGDDGRVLADEIVSQWEDHRPYGGIVPEVAARAHLEHMDALVARTMEAAGMGFGDLDGVAVTGGPGLIGGVLVGVMTAKAVAAVHGLPFLAINHLEGHALTARLTDGVEFPYLLLLISGGHCQLLAVQGVGKYRRLGTTIDDALGEAFDKTAKMLGLGYPGGPAVEAAAQKGDPTRFALPRPLKGRAGCDFSFSGLKTAVRHAIDALPPGPLADQDGADQDGADQDGGDRDWADSDVADMCASFQAAAGDVLADRTANAIEAFGEIHPDGDTIVVAGGVAANRALGGRLKGLAEEHGFRFVVPPPRLCTDNGVMIAWAGIERLRQGLTDGLDFRPRPRWPLDPEAPPATGAGIKA